MFHLLLFGLILYAQSGQPATTPKAPQPIEVSDRESWQHFPPGQDLFLRIKADNVFYENIPVDTTVDAQGNVVSAKASREQPSRVKFPDGIFDQAEALVKDLHFTPFERNGHAVPAKFQAYVRLLPPELKPAKHVPFPRVKDWNTLKIKLDRTGCFGTCPSYHVEVHGDGTVLFEGGSYVVFTGHHRGSVPVDNVLELVKLFEKADYFSLADKYQAPITDNPSYTTSIEFDGAHKQVVDYVGLQVGMPMAVSDLEDAIDRLSDSARWTKGNENTLASLQAEHWNFKSKAAADTLARVAAGSNAGLVRDLVLAGVLLNGKDTDRYAGDSPLEAAAAGGESAMLSTLLNAGAAADPARLARATVKAAQSGKVEALHLLLEGGANIGARDERGRTVLMGAAASGSPEMVKEVLKYHPNINAAANPAPPVCTEEMKQSDNCPEFESNDGRTALMEAVSFDDPQPAREGIDRVEVVHLLLAAGADVNARDKAGNTALILCRDNPQQALLLLQAGADPNARNREGTTALSNTYDDEIKELLLKHGAVEKPETEEDI